MSQRVDPFKMFGKGIALFGISAFVLENDRLTMGAWFGDLFRKEMTDVEIEEGAQLCRDLLDLLGRVLIRKCNRDRGTTFDLATCVMTQYLPFVPGSDTFPIEEL